MILRRLLGDMLAGLLMLAPGALSAASAAPALSPSTRLAPSMNREQLGAFIDGVVRARMAADRIAGVTLVVVDSNGVVLKRGYGIADARTRAPIDPDRTVFPIGSSTKLFTTVAVLKLAQEGRIDLDANIRRYLKGVDFDDHKGTLTARDLLSHTPGFDNWIFNYYAEFPELRRQSTAAQLSYLHPAQIRRPREIIAYSNYGMDLLGEMVAQVSGMSFADYVNREILDPLGMRHSDMALRTTLEGQGNARTRALARQRGWSHEWRDGDFVRQPFRHPLPATAPEGSLSTTAGDMARFLQMYLRGGTLDGATILTPASITLTRTPAFPNQPQLATVGHGFWRYNWAGYRGYGHGGFVDHIVSEIAWIPELDIGIYASANTANADFLWDLPRLLAASLAPSRGWTPPSAPPGAFQRAREYEGDYTYTRATEKVFGKAALLAGNFLKVSASPDGYLVVGATGRRASTLAPNGRFVEVGRDRFRALNDGVQLGFVRDAAGRVEVLWWEQGHGNFTKLRFDERPETLYWPFILAALSGVGLLFGAWLRRYKGASLPLMPDEARGWRMLVCASAIWLLYVVGFFVALSTYQGVHFIYDPQPLPATRFIWITSLVASIAAVIAIVSLIPIWRGATLRRGRKIRATLVVIVLIAASCAIWNWRLLPA